MQTILQKIWKKSVTQIVLNKNKRFKVDSVWLLSYLPSLSIVGKNCNEQTIGSTQLLCSPFFKNKLNKVAKATKLNKFT